MLQHDDEPEMHEQESGVRDVSPTGPTSLVPSSAFALSAPSATQVQVWHPPPSGRRLRWGRLLLVVSLLMILLGLGLYAYSRSLPRVAEQATVSIQLRRVLVNETISQTVPLRSISPTDSATQDVTATGHGAQDALQAHGTVTFYNTINQVQNVPAGTQVCTQDEQTCMATDASIQVPPGNPPAVGQMPVSAHALIAGAAGNIARHAIYGSVVNYIGLEAVNQAAFTGGQDAASYPVLLQQDIDQTSSVLTASLLAHLQTSSVGPDAQLVSPLNCHAQTQTSQPAGSHVAQAHMTVTVTCHGSIYAGSDAQAAAIAQVSQQESATLAGQYRMESPSASILSAQPQGDSSALLSLRVQERWTYEMSQAQLASLAQLIANHSIEQARQLLLSQPGIAKVTINSLPADSTSLPAHAQKILLTAG